MKAVIVEIDGNYAVALDKKGDFLKLKRKNSYQVGYEIEIASASGSKFRTAARIASIAAVFLLILGISFGAYFYSVPYTYINVDINPSVEITANIFNKIIKVEGMNEDGKKLVQNLHSKNKSIQAGIGDILESAIDRGYLKDTKSSAVLFTVSGKSQAKVESLEEDIKNTAATELKTAKVEADVLTQHISLEKHKAVKKTGVSPGKQVLIDELRQLGSTAKEKDLEKEPVKRLADEIKSYKNKKAVPGKSTAPNDKPKANAKGNGNNGNETKAVGQANGNGLVKNTEKTGKDMPNKGKPINNAGNQGKKEHSKSSGLEQNKDKNQQSKGSDIKDKNKNSSGKSSNSSKSKNGPKDKDTEEAKGTDSEKIENKPDMIFEEESTDLFENVKTNDENVHDKEEPAKGNHGSDGGNKENGKKDKDNTSDSGGKDNGNDKQKGNGKK